jgi:hypothetical protein
VPTALWNTVNQVSEFIYVLAIWIRVKAFQWGYLLFPRTSMESVHATYRAMPIEQGTLDRLPDLLTYNNASKIEMSAAQ